MAVRDMELKLAWSLLGLQVFQQLGPNIAPIQTGVLIDSVRLSTSQAGLILGAETLGLAAAMISSPLLLRALAIRPLAFLSLLILLALNLVSAMTNAPLALAAIRVLCGFAAGGAVVAGTAALASARRVDRVTSLLSMVTPLLIALAIVTASFAAQRFGARGLFFYFAGVAALAAVPTLALAPVASPGASGGSGVGRRLLEVLRSPPALAWVIGFFGPAAAWTFSERIGIGLGFTVSEVGTVLGATAIPGVLGGAAALWLAKPERTRSLALVGLTGFGVFSAALPLVQSQLAFILVMTLLTFFFVACQPFLIDLVCEQDRSGALAAAMLGWALLASALSPVIAGHLVEAAPLKWLAAIPATTTLIAGLVLARYSTSEPMNA